MASRLSSRDSHTTNIIDDVSGDGGSKKRVGGWGAGYRDHGKVFTCSTTRPNTRSLALTLIVGFIQLAESNSHKDKWITKLTKDRSSLFKHIISHLDLNVKYPLSPGVQVKDIQIIHHINRLLLASSTVSRTGFTVVQFKFRAHTVLGSTGRFSPIVLLAKRLRKHDGVAVIDNTWPLSSERG